MELARGVEERRQRLSPGCGDVVCAGRPPLRREVKGLDAVVAMNQLQDGVVPGHRRHELEVEVPGQRLGLVRVKAVAEAERQQIDAGVAVGEVRYVRLDLDDVANELVLRVRIEPVVLAKVGLQVGTRSVHVA